MIFIMLVYQNKLYLYSLLTITKTMRNFIELIAAMFLGILLVIALPFLLINDVPMTYE